MAQTVSGEENGKPPGRGVGTLVGTPDEWGKFGSALFDLMPPVHTAPPAASPERTATLQANIQDVMGSLATISQLEMPSPN